MTTNQEDTWPIFRGDGTKREEFLWPEAPPWRKFAGIPPEKETSPPEAPKPPKLEIRREVVDLVNAAIFLRRPLLVTGSPGTGKSSLARTIAYELGLGRVLAWPIYTRSTLQDGLYRYDAIGRLQERNEDIREIGRYIRLGPLGMALLPTKRPRVLLIDEIDKSDIDFPNELLNIFEEGWFEIMELARLPDNATTISVQRCNEAGGVPITKGRVECYEFPIVVMTSNGEREFPAPFLRRCIRVELQSLDEKALEAAVRAHFGTLSATEEDPVKKLIQQFLDKHDHNPNRATDQLLNAVHLVVKQNLNLPTEQRERLVNALLRELK